MEGSVADPAPTEEAAEATADRFGTARGPSEPAEGKTGKEEKRKPITEFKVRLNIKPLVDDKSKLWKEHPGVAAACAYDPDAHNDDGMFWMEYEDFCKHFHLIVTPSHSPEVEHLCVHLFLKGARILVNDKVLVLAAREEVDLLCLCTLFAILSWGLQIPTDRSICPSKAV